ncbi:MAG: PAS domain-containing protein [Bradymonadia bacterium]
MGQEVSDKGFEPGEIPDASTLQILRRYMNALAGFAGLLTPDGRVIECNDYTVRFTDIPKATITGAPLWHAPWWSHSKAIRKRIRYAVQRAAQGERVGFEVDIRSPEGDTLIVDFSVLPYFDEAGNVICLVPHGNDVTERHRQGTELHSTYTLLRQHMDNSPIGVIEWDRELRVVRWSGRAQAIFGWQTSEALGRTPADLGLVHPEDEARVWGELQGLMEGTEQSRVVENRNYTRDGAVIHCRWHNSTLMADRGPGTTFLLSLVEDCTHQREAEVALARSRDELEQRVRARTYELRRSQARFQLAIEGSGEGIWSLEFGMVPPELYLAPRIYDMFDLDPSQVTPDVDWILGHMHPEDRKPFMKVFNSHMFHRTPCAYEFRFQMPDDSWRWFRIRGQATWSEKGHPVRMAGSVADIQAERDAAKALEETQARLIEASRSAGKSEVAAQVLHNVGNVLNSVNVSATVAIEKVQKLKVEGIAKAAQMLNGQLGDVGGKGPQLIEYLSKIGERLTQDQATLIEELQRLSKDVDHIKHVVGMQRAYARVGGVMVAANLAELLEDALQINRSSMERHGVKLDLNVTHIPEILVERDKVLQILINLVRNAIQAMREVEGEHLLTISLERVGDDRCAFEIKDSGVGISEENLTRIFAYGFTTKSDGTGFGLHASALDAQSMEGTLTAHSDGPGHGAMFRLELPIRLPTNHQRAEMTPALHRQITQAPDF